MWKVIGWFCPWMVLESTWTTCMAASGLMPMVLMIPDRESSLSSDEFMLRVGKVTSAEEIAKMSGNLKYRPVRRTWDLGL